MIWLNPNCHNNDHDFHGTGRCLACGHRLRCVCGCFVRADGLASHKCRVAIHGLMTDQLPEATG